MLGYYIHLRLRQFVRFFSFNDVNPLVGIPVLAVLFVFVSLLVFDKLPHAAWVYAGMAALTVAELQQDRTNRYLQSLTDRKTYFRLKLAENLLYYVPFALFLLFRLLFVQFAVCLVFTVVYSAFNVKLARPALKSVRTPYRAYSFEHNYAFRLFFILYLIYIAIMLVAIPAGNVYLFITPYFILLFFVQTAYGLPEEPFYIWVHRMSAGAFLKNKAGQVLRNTFINTLPFLLLGSIFFTGQLVLILICCLFGFVANVGSMLVKYQFYPNDFIVQISQLLLFGFTMACFISPPGIIIVIVFLVYSFFRAKNNLSTYLHA